MSLKAWIWTIASQGESEDEALSNLQGALELYCEPPPTTRPLLVRTIEVELVGLNPQPSRQVKRWLDATGFS